MIRLFIDADACPVVDIAIGLAARFGVESVIITDTSHIIERSGVVTVTVEKGSDIVDFKLVNMIGRGDIAVTQDYGLAAMCLARGAVPINQNGLIFSDSNIERLLFTRYASAQIRRAGGRTKGPSKRTKRQDDEFAAALTDLLEKMTNPAE